MATENTENTNEAMGKSDKFSFEEALEDAINNLPDRAPYESVKVMEIVAVVGGFTNERTIHVRVRRSPINE